MERIFKPMKEGERRKRIRIIHIFFSSSASAGGDDDDDDDEQNLSEKEKRNPYFLSFS